MAPRNRQAPCRKPWASRRRPSARPFLQSASGTCASGPEANFARSAADAFACATTICSTSPFTEATSPSARVLQLCRQFLNLPGAEGAGVRDEIVGFVLDLVERRLRSRRARGHVRAVAVPLSAVVVLMPVPGVIVVVVVVILAHGRFAFRAIAPHPLAARGASEPRSSSCRSLRPGAILRIRFPPDIKSSCCEPKLNAGEMTSNQGKVYVKRPDERGRHALANG